MDRERKNRLLELWLRLRWVVFAICAGAFVFLIIWTRIDSTQSRWRLERNGSFVTFIEKSASPEKARDFRSYHPALAFSWLGSLGIAIDANSAIRPGDDLVTFAGWGDFAAIGRDDPLIFSTLKGQHAADFRLASIMSKVFKLGEPVAPCFATSDGRLLFIDLKSDGELGVIHGMTHVLAHKNLPRAITAVTDPAKAQSYDAKTVRALRFVDEAVATLVSDLWLSGAKGGSEADLRLLEAFDGKRYAPDGPIYTDEALTFAFGSDPRSPEAFAGAANFLRGAAKEKGLPAVLDFAGHYIKGEYKDLDSLCEPLGGSLHELLKRYLGSEDIPE